MDKIKVNNMLIDEMTDMELLDLYRVIWFKYMEVDGFYLSSFLNQVTIEVLERMGYAHRN